MSQPIDESRAASAAVSGLKNEVPQAGGFSRGVRIATWLWTGLILLRCLFYFEINLTLGAFLWWAVDLALFVGGVILLGISAVAIARKRRTRSVAASICLILAAVLCWATPYGYLLGASFRLLRHEAHYEREIAEIHAAGVALDDPYVEPGPPIRVAFSWGGLLDNWVGIVHDPSHTADDLEQSRLWFGGTLREAWPLWGDWYLCWFT